MAQMGLAGGGYSDYLNSQAYAQKRSDIQNANALYSQNVQQNQAKYSDYISSLNKEFLQYEENKRLKGQELIDANGGIVDGYVESQLKNLGFTKDEVDKYRTNSQELVANEYDAKLDSAITNRDNVLIQDILDDIDKNKDKITTEAYQGFYSKKISSIFKELEKLTYKDLNNRMGATKSTYDELYTNKKISLEMYNKAYKDLEDLLAKKKKLYDDSNDIESSSNYDVKKTSDKLGNRVTRSIMDTMGVSAAGNATEEAFQEGANYYAGLGYGVASGVVEVATEKMFGGATKALTGAGVFDGITKSVADTGLKRIAKNALEEGIEEVAAELVNPALKSIYKGGEALNEYGKGEYWLGVGKAGAIGSLTALAYSGSVGYGLSKIGKGYVGAEADINESLMEIDTQKKKAENLFTNDKLTEKNDAQISSNVQENYRNIERTLQKANDKKRASLIEKFSLGSAFESNGTMKVDFATKLGLVAPTTQVDTQGQETTSRTLASLLRKEYYSPSLRGNETEVETDLKSITEKLKEDEVKLAEEQGREVKEIAEVKPFTGELTDKGKKNYAQTKKAMNYLNSKSGRNVNIVVVDPHESINANIVDDRTIYIGADTFENDTWAGAIVHEYTHYAEGTKEYVKLVNYLQSDPKLLDKAFTSFVNRGYANADMIKTINDKQARGETLTEQETTYMASLFSSRTFQSEMGAIMSESLLGTEEFIDTIVSKETSIAEKVMKKIKDLKAMFERLGNAEARAEYKRLSKAEKLYLNAIEKAGYKYRNGKILVRRKKEEVDSASQNEYNSDEIQLSRKVDRKQPTEHEFTKYDHGTLRARVMKKNSEGTGLYPIDFDRTANHFVVYYNNGSDSYKIIKTFDLEIYDDILTELEENIKNGKIYRTSKDLRTDISRFRIEKRRSSNSDDTIAGRKPNGENGGLHRGESTSEGKSSNRTSGKNQSNIKSSRKEDISSAITLRAKALPESKVRGNYIFSIKWRGELTNEKIVKYLKDGVWHNNDRTSFAKALKEYDYGIPWIH